MADFVYKQSNWNKVFHSLPHWWVLGAGAAGPGKSLALTVDPLIQVKVEDDRCRDKHHEFHQRWGSSTGEAWHLRRTGDDLDQTIQRSKLLYPQVDPSADYNENKRTWTFRSGYRIRFGHCHNPDDWMRYRSQQCTHLAFDELIEFTEQQFDELSTRVRSSDPVLSKMMRIRMCTNPQVPRTLSEKGIKLQDPMWVRRRFVDPAPKGKTTFVRREKRRDGTWAEKTWIYWPATLYDNPDPDFVRSYEENLLLAKPHIRAAQLYGDWYITAGSYYGDVWNERLHTCKPFRVPAHWPKWRSMDWGFKKPGCVHWWAMDDDGNIWCIRELWFQERWDWEIAKEIRSIETDFLGIKWRNGRSPLTGPADSQIWEERGEHVKTKAQTFAELGVNWVKADKKSRDHNAELLHRRLGDHRGGTTTPGLVIFDTCRQLIKWIPSAQEEDATGGLVDTKNDHAGDSVLYSCAYASHGRSGISYVSDEDFEWRRKRASRAHRPRGSYGSEV